LAPEEATLAQLRQIVMVHDDNPVLRKPARPIRRVDRQTRRLMDDMIETMREASGVGLAAPQIGLDIRVFVAEVPVDMEDPEGETRVHALADPEVLWVSADLEEGREACLSIPELFGDVPRHLSIRVRALDRYSRPVELTLMDFEARVFQHEIDHLDGVLFVDRVTGPEKLYFLEEGEDGELVRVPVAVAAG